MDILWNNAMTDVDLVAHHKIYFDNIFLRRLSIGLLCTRDCMKNKNKVCTGRKSSNCRLKTSGI